MDGMSQRHVACVQADVVVMVTREVESGSLKCHRYWPDPTSKVPSKTMVFDRIQVDYLETRVDLYFTIRKFRLTKDGKSRTITHFSYDAWPDHGVPLTSREFLEFRDSIYSAYQNRDAPIVIHCSAGVGRTGTFCAIDRFFTLPRDLMLCSIGHFSAILAIEDGQPFNIKGIVEDLRQARNFMVQTFVQYAFVYRTVLDRLRTMLAEVGVEIQRRQAIEKAEAAEAAARAEQEAKERAKAQAAAEAELEAKARQLALEARSKAEQDAKVKAELEQAKARQEAEEKARQAQLKAQEEAKKAQEVTREVWCRAFVLARA